MTERGYSTKKDDYAQRLRRIEGQVRGVQRMIDEDVYCIDVLTQVSAINKALQAVAVGLIDEHVRHCLRNAVEGGDDVTVDAMVDEATKALQRLMKS
jgi:CsoR family transcriptional regulator, copper-sensing transcriptional repressor